MRKDFTPASATVACKAGYNDDPHHGHLDCGSFILTWRNISFITPAPRTPYDEQYFGALRWSHLEAATEGQNVVLVNGEDQICAKLKDQPWKSGVGGPISLYRDGKRWAYVEMDPTHAYPGRDLKLWHRWIALDKRSNTVIVLDRVGSNPGSKIEVLFHPGVPFDFAAWVPYYAVEVNAPTAEIVIASVFSPAGHAAPQNATLAATAGGWRVSYTQSGQPVTVAFAEGAVSCPGKD